MKKIVSLFVVFLCVIGLVACGKKSAVIGTWTDMDGYNTMEFNEKTGRMMSGSQEVGFKYTIDDKTISADMGYMVDVMDYSLSKVDDVDCLKMKINGENFTFYRKEDISKIKPAENKIKEKSVEKNNNTTNANNENTKNYREEFKEMFEQGFYDGSNTEFVGTWINKDDSSEIIQFIDGKEGKWFFGKEVIDFYYTFGKTCINFVFDTSNPQYLYSLNGNELTIDWDNKKHTYIKQ